AEAKINIANMTLTEHKDNTTAVRLTLETKSLAQLGRILVMIEGVKGVISVARVGDEAMVKNSP
ncbi:MAG: ACT domain-containing protein, partial [Dehalococcoidales bacterium]